MYFTIWQYDIWQDMYDLVLHDFELQYIKV